MATAGAEKDCKLKNVTRGNPLSARRIERMLKRQAGAFGVRAETAIDLDVQRLDAGGIEIDSSDFINNITKAVSNNSTFTNVDAVESESFLCSVTFFLDI